MPTPTGVNYLLQFLITFLSIPQLSEDKNPKVDVHPICPLIISYSYPIGMLVLLHLQINDIFHYPPNFSKTFFETDTDYFSISGTYSWIMAGYCSIRNAYYSAEAGYWEISLVEKNLSLKITKKKKKKWA